MKQRITRVTCDKCGAVDTDGYKTLTVPVDIKTTVGGGTENEEVDLCPTCQKTALDLLVSALDTKQAATFVKEFKKLPTPTRRKKTPEEVLAGE